jgi:hypothetical protein
MAMSTAEIIDQLGGLSEVARQLSVPVTTVSSWKIRNIIPEWRQTAVMRLALEKGVALSTADFPQREAA